MIGSVLSAKRPMSRMSEARAAIPSPAFVVGGLVAGRETNVSCRQQQ